MEHLVPEQIRMEGYPQCLCLNSRRELYANPRALADLESTIRRPTDWLVFVEHDEVTYELRFLPYHVPGAVPVRRPKNRKTAIFGAGPLLAKHNFLAVEPTRIREISYILVPTEGEYPAFRLQILEGENRPSQNKRRKRGRPEPEKTQSDR